MEAEQPAPEQPKKRKPNSGSFVKGDPRIKPLQDRAAASGEPVGPQGDDLLEAMVYVLREPKRPGESELVKSCRAWKAKDLKGFMNRRAELERAGKGVTDSNESVQADEGTELVLATIRKLIDRANRAAKQ